MNIVITGSTGFLGKHVVNSLMKKYSDTNLTMLDSSNYNLLLYKEAKLMVEVTKPEVIIHLAALSGGIGINKKYPADFYFKNTILTANVFEAAAKAGVKKMIYTMGGCSYPNSATSPIDESQMWEGFPHPDTAGYSCAKKMGIVASDSYRQQYGMETVVLVPGNMYGEYDNYIEEASHVIPALIRRFYEAKLNNTDSVNLWGDGTPLRDFVYAGDVSDTFPYFVENTPDYGPINISSGTTTKISDLANLIADLIGYKGKLKWDTTKPRGQSVKIFDVNKLNSFGLNCSTPLKVGLEKTINWFVSNYNNNGIIRL